MAPMDYIVLGLMAISALAAAVACLTIRTGYAARAEWKTTQGRDEQPQRESIPREEDDAWQS